MPRCSYIECNRSLSKADRSQAPAPDELEVSVFGPGRGECIVVHVPNGPWFVIDSHNILVKSKRTPVAVAYLRDTLKVTSIHGLFLTHWHADHTSGATELLKAFNPNLALVGLPIAFSQKEFASYMADLTSIDLKTKKVREILSAMTFLKANPKIRAIRLGELVRLNPPNSPWHLEALSPSMEDERLALAQLADYQQGKRRTYDINSGCAVIRLEAGGLVAIFSSDLDIGKTVKHGWQAIVSTSSPHLPANIVKVGHHGSSTAFHPPAWDFFKKGTAKPISVITPFPIKNGYLPKKEMLQEISKYSGGLFVTANPPPNNKAGKLSRRRAPFSSYQPTPVMDLSRVGHVRIRLSAGNPIPRIDLFGDSAYEVS